MPKKQQKRGGKALKCPAPRPMDSLPLSDDEFSRDNFRALLARIDALEKEKAKLQVGIEEGVGTSSDAVGVCRSARVSKGNKMHLSLFSRPMVRDRSRDDVAIVSPGTAASGSSDERGASGQQDNIPGSGISNFLWGTGEAAYPDAISCADVWDEREGVCKPAPPGPTPAEYWAKY